MFGGRNGTEAAWKCSGGAEAVWTVMEEGFGTVKEAIKSLAKTPEYLLLFGIIVVFALVADKLPEIVALPLLLVSVVASITIIFIVRKSYQEQEYFSGINREITAIKESILLKKELYEQNGILDIYPNREEYLKKILVEDIERKISEIERDTRNSGVQKKGLNIYLVGISLRGFFHKDYRGDYEQLTNNFDRYLKNGKLKIQALVINPVDSIQAQIRQRSDCYPDTYCESNLKNDLIKVKGFYEDWKNKTSLEIRTYQASAACFMVIVDDEYVVVEQYHSGGFGGKIPLIKYGLTLPTGRKFKDHFDFIWNDNTTKPIEELESNSERSSAN